MVLAHEGISGKTVDQGLSAGVEAELSLGLRVQLGLGGRWYEDRWIVNPLRLFIGSSVVLEGEIVITTVATLYYVDFIDRCPI